MNLSVLTYARQGWHRQQFEKHLEENLQRYTEGKISASERRVLVTKWVGKACTKVGSNGDMVVRSFKNCHFFISG